MADNPSVSVIKINNVDYDIKDAKARADLAALIGSGDAAGAIDNLNEIIAFLNGIDTDDPTLANQLLAINTNKADKSATVSNVSYSSSKIQKTINGSTTDVVTASTIVTDGGGLKGVRFNNADATVSNGVATITVTIPDGVAVDSTWVANSTNPVQSKVVKAALDGKADSSSLATVATSGSYNDLSNKPTIPTVPTNVSSFTNDAGYQTSANVSATLADVYDGYDSTTETLSFTFPTT